MEWIILVFTVIPIMVITVLMPYITRKTESFGVSIPEDIFHSDELKNMRKKYVKQISFFSMGILLLTIISLFVLKDLLKDLIVLYSTIIFLGGSFLFYLIFHRKMKQQKEKQNWKMNITQAITIDTGFHHQKKTYSNLWFLVPFTISICTTIISIIFYKKIPDKIPVHYNLNGNISDWSNKTVMSVFQLPAIQLFLTGLMLFTNRLISKSKQQIDSANPEKSKIQTLVFRRRWSAYIILTNILIALLFLFIQLTLIENLDIKWVINASAVITGLWVLGAIILSIKTGQGGSRVKVDQGNRETLINYDDDRYWKLGIFYFNPKDPSIWVEKRFGSGWTINMARPIAWIILLIIIFIAVFISTLK